MIAVEKLTVRAGKFSLSNVSFEVPTGCYGVLMGRTASGKSTILETICGLKRAVSGRIVLDGRDITRLKPAERGVGYVPQDGALFSTMSVGEHLGFALDIRGRRRVEIDRRVAELAELLGIGHLLDRGPEGLSGGERQRVALGRALSVRPSILCLDEPLSALDEDTREEMCGLLKDVCRETGVTTLHVTHSRAEAAELGQHVLRIEGGVVSQVRAV
ncbi:MAG: ATP-binding cassette domain-containing protein [Phycisphaerae bacterium]|nr:ATP-binding cassette domain-containing protein [Phycisphaerae bacterium]